MSVRALILHTGFLCGRSVDVIVLKADANDLIDKTHPELEDLKDDSLGSSSELKHALPARIVGSIRLKRDISKHFQWELFPF